MRYAVVGRISAEVCSECQSLGAEGFLRLYDGTLPRSMNIGSLGIVASTSESSLPLLDMHYLAREPLDADGGYQIGIDDRQHDYTGGKLLAVLELPFVKPMDGPVRNLPAVCLLMEAIEPRWNQEGKLARMDWSHCIPAADWCQTKQHFGLPCNRNAQNTSPSDIVFSK